MDNSDEGDCGEKVLFLSDLTCVSQNAECKERELLLLLLEGGKISNFQDCVMRAACYAQKGSVFLLKKCATGSFTVWMAATSQ